MFDRLCIVVLCLVLISLVSSVTPEETIPDLSIHYIHRDPPVPSWCDLVEIREGVPYLSPDAPELKDRWPTPGKTVIFSAHIVNQGNASSLDAKGTWRLDGEIVKKETFPPLNPGAKYSSEIKWDWGIEPHEITFEVAFITTETLELTEDNNRLSIRTDALPFCFYVNRIVAQTFQANKNIVGSNSFADWLNAHINRFNYALRQSKYKVAPDGCKEQVYVDRLLYYETMEELNLLRTEYDSVAQGIFVFEPHKHMRDWARGWDPYLLMALANRMGMADLSPLDIEPSDNYVPGPEDKPLYWRYKHKPLLFKEEDGQYRFSEFCVLALNRMYGRPRGFIGDYFYDMPEEYVLSVLDRKGKGVDRARIRIFQKKQDGTLELNPIVDDRTDRKGFLKLPNRAAPDVETPLGFVQHNNPFGKIELDASNGLFLIEVKARNHADYIWRSITDFNVAYWREVIDTRWRDYPVYTLPLKIQTNIPCVGAPNPPVNFQSQIVDPERLSLSWLPSMDENIKKYRLYSMKHFEGTSSGEFEFTKQILDPFTKLDNIKIPEFDVYFAITAVDSHERESPFSPWLYKPYCPRLKSLAYSQEGHFYLFDEQTNRILRMDESGRFVPFYIHPPSPESLRISNISWSPLNELAVCNIEKNQIEFYDPEGRFLRTIGKSGIDTGELNNPKDVAFNMKKEIAVADRKNRRIQLFDHKGRYLARFGEIHLDDPVAIAFSPKGDIHILDGLKKTCFVFNEGVNHKFFHERSYGEFVNPNDIFINEKGEIYISDPEQQAILVFSSSGRLLRTERPAAYGNFPFTIPCGLSQDNKGHIIYVDRLSATVRTLE